MTQGLFQECEQKDLALTGCKLMGAEIQSMLLKGVDLSECVLDGIAVAPELLRGVTVSLEQAPLILGLYGVKIRL